MYMCCGNILQLYLYMYMYMYLGAVLLFKLVEVGPGVSQVRVYLDGSLEPLASLANLTLCPEEAAEGVGEGEK